MSQPRAPACLQVRLPECQPHADAATPRSSSVPIHRRVLRKYSLARCAKCFCALPCALPYLHCGPCVRAEDKTVCGSITRADVADLVVKALRSDKTNNKVLSAIDNNSIPGSFEVFAL